MRYTDVFRRFRSGLLLAPFFFLSCFAAESPQNKSVFLKPPCILVWYWFPETLENERYLKDLDWIATNTPFNLIDIYPKKPLSFVNEPEKMKEALSKATEHAHKLGLKLVPCLYQPWPPFSDLRDRYQSMVIDGEVTLDSNGSSSYRATAEPQRYIKPVAGGLVAAYMFRKSADGLYEPNSLQELDEKQIRVISANDNTVEISISTAPEHAGKTVFIMTHHEYPYPDMFSDYFQEHYRHAMDVYADIPLDGVSLDEFRYMTLNRMQEFRQRIYSIAMVKSYEARYGKQLKRTLFAMRYAPVNNPWERAAAINQYFDLLCFQPTKVDHLIQDYSQKIFGSQVFMGMHNTFHNSLVTDEVWATGLDWWNLKRDFAQMDENLPVAVRLGIGVCYPQPIFYNMFYSKNSDPYIYEAAIEARYNGRVDYHAYNDDFYSYSFKDENFIKRVNRVEQRIDLLNLFSGPRPDTKLLVIFGFPALTNWFPNSDSRNGFDINGKLDAEGKVNALWKAGIPAAMVSSAVIDSGRLTLDAAGKPVINHHQFEAVVFIGPQYSKPVTLSFLRRYVEKGGKLILDGEMTRGFDGESLGKENEIIISQSVAQQFSIEAVKKLGVVQDWPVEGSRLEDGSVILTDPKTIETDEPHPFEFQINGRHYRLVCSGLAAFKATADGGIEKLVAASFRSLECDGKMLLSREQPEDLALRQSASGLVPLAF